MQSVYSTAPADLSIVGLWKMADRIKVTADAYITFLKEHQELRLKKERITFKKTIIFMQYNSRSHAAHKTTGYLQRLGFCELR